jgi:hypothetical protein
MPRTRTTKAPTPPAQGDTPQALLRREHAGKWLAWSEDESRILAVGDTPEEIRAAAEGSGHPRFIYDWVPPAESRQTTGLE